MAGRFYEDFAQCPRVRSGPTYDTNLDAYAEDEPRPSKRPTSYEIPITRHRRTQSYNAPSTQPVARPRQWGPRKTYDHDDEQPRYKIVYEPRETEQSQHRIDNTIPRPIRAYQDDPLRSANDSKQITSSQPMMLGLENSFQNRLHFREENEQVKPRTRERSRGRPMVSDERGRIPGVGDRSRTGREAVVDWFLSTPADNEVESTSTEAVVDERGFQPSKSYLRVPHPAPREIIPKDKAGHTGNSRRAQSRSRMSTPAYSNTSTETVIANTRPPRNGKYDGSAREDEEERIRYNDFVKQQHFEAIRYQQEAFKSQLQEGSRVQQEKSQKAQHDKEFSSFLRDEFQKVPKRMKNAEKKWPGLDYRQALGKAFLSESSFSGITRASDEDTRRPRRDSEHQRSKSIGGDGKERDRSRPAETRWAYSGLPVNRFLRNPTGAYPNKMQGKAVSSRKAAEDATSENIAKVRDMMEYKARDSRGPRPPSPDWVAEYVRAGFEPPRQVLSKHSQSKGTEK